MTLKKSLRTVQKVTREIDKVQRAEHRTDQAFAKLEAQLLKTPISTLGMTYDPVAGLSSHTYDLNTPAGTLTYGPTTADPTSIRINPTEHTVAGITIKPMDLLLTNWLTLIPIEVSNESPEFRSNINWVKKTDRSSSSIFLLDPENSEYYYPVETDFTGEVLEGHPRSGLFAFEPFRCPTNLVELHLSGIKLGPPRSTDSKSSLKFVFERDDLNETIENELQNHGVANFLRQGYAEQTGCSIAAMLLGSSLLASIAGMVWLMTA